MGNREREERNGEGDGREGEGKQGIKIHETEKGAQWAEE